MYHFVVCRHTDDCGDKLSEKGVSDARWLGKTLREHVGLEDILIISSSSNRTLETAHHIAQCVHASVEPSDPLKGTFERVLQEWLINGIIAQLVERAPLYRSIIVVTHSDMVLRIFKGVVDTINGEGLSWMNKDVFFDAHAYNFPWNRYTCYDTYAQRRVPNPE